jgi:RHS repeat-associated protein
VGSLWEYDAQHNSLITAGNGGTKPLQAAFTIYYNEGTQKYDSFGNLVSSSGSLGNSFRYTGREFDTEAGLYYFRARLYDQTTGRFLSEDPIRFRGGLNFYEYVENRVVN